MTCYTVKEEVMNRLALSVLVGTDNSLIVVVRIRTDTHDHPHFAFTVKRVLEEVSQFGVSVGNNLDNGT